MLRTVVLAVSALYFSILSSVVVSHPYTLGWLESAYILPAKAKVTAKLDTGARTSSINAANITPFEKDGKPWVRFVIPNDKQDKQGDIKMELPVEREIRIKEHVGDSVARLVVAISVCLDGRKYRVPVTLADRSNFNYPLLLGRTMLQGKFAVDPARKFTSSVACN